MTEPNFEIPKKGSYVHYLVYDTQYLGKVEEAYWNTLDDWDCPHLVLEEFVHKLEVNVYWNSKRKAWVTYPDYLRKIQPYMADFIDLF